MKRQDSTPQYLREQAQSENGQIERGFFSAQDGQKGRDGGPYLDVVEREAAELRRADFEDREPDLDNPGPTVGTQLVVAAQVDNNIYSNPSMAAAPGIENSQNDELFQSSDHLASPVQVLPVDLRTEPDDDTPESGSPVGATAFDGARVNVSADGSPGLNEDELSAAAEVNVSNKKKRDNS